MLINFDDIKEVTIRNFNNGDGAVSAKMFMQPNLKIMTARIPKGASIGIHQHTTSCDINYCLSGKGSAVCEGIEEILTAGVCHYCPKGSSHSISNTGEDELILFTVVAEEQ